jgi:short-subunit dehydrogenase
MSNKKIWFITGASRGMGADFAGAEHPRHRRLALAAAGWDWHQE